MFAIALFILGLEGFFRITRPEDALMLAMGREDARFHHSLKANSELHLVSSVPGEYDVTARINNFGFRGPDIQIEKKAGQKRILIAGDSFTFGVGARDDETIPAFMQRFLDPTGERIEVINAGIGSYSPLTHYLKFRDDLPKFKLDLIVLMLDFSDLRDDWDMEKNLIYDQRGNMVGANPYYEYGRFQPWNYLRSKSLVCRAFHNKVIRTFLKVRKIGFMEYLRAKLEGKRAKAVIATTGQNTIEFDGRLFMRGKPKADEIRAHFKRTGKYLLMCRDLALQHNAKFLLVMYPYGVYVGPNQWAKGRVFWGFEEGKVDTDYFAYDLVRQFAEENQIYFVNLLNDFLEHKDEELFFPYDGHFKPAANRVASEALIRHPEFQKVLSELQ